ncbi:hypothetical protein [Methanocaldococcus infernus]
MIGMHSVINAYPSIAPLYGLIFGPFYGSLIILLVNIVKFLINPKAYYFGIFSFLPPILSVVSAGYLARNNLKIPILIYIFGFILYFNSYVGREAPYHPIFDILAFLLLISAGKKITELLYSNNSIHSFVSALSFSYIVVMVDHLYGSILASYLYHIPVNDYVKAIPTYIFERTLMASLGSVFIFLTIKLVRELIKMSDELKSFILNEYIKENFKAKLDIKVDKELMEKYGIKVPDEEFVKKELENIFKTIK